MSKTHVTAVLVLGILLAGCEQPTDPVLAVPDRGMPTSEPTHMLGLTADGPFDEVQGTARASIQQAATGGRASGHVDFETPIGTIASEHYSFTALQTAASGFAAKGAYELHLTTVSGNNNRAQGRVICVAVVGNQARVAARVERLWIAGVRRDPDEFFATGLHNIWNVTDGGEGEGAVDAANLMFFTDAAGAALHCDVGANPVPQVATDKGNVHVSGD